MNINYDDIYREVRRLPFYDNKGGRLKESNWEGQTIIRHRNCKFRYRMQEYKFYDSSSAILRSYTAEEIEYILGYSEKDLPKLVFSK